MLAAGAARQWHPHFAGSRARLLAGPRAAHPLGHAAQGRVKRAQLARDSGEVAVPVAAAEAAAVAAAPAAAATAAMGQPPRLLCSSFLRDSMPADQQLAVVLLNWTLPSITAELWQRATLRVCADGGANRLYDELHTMLPGGRPAEEVRAAHLPSVICGDLDSVRPDVLAYYSERGVVVDDQSADQMTTDLQKCVSYVVAHAAEQRLQPERLTVVALGGLGGRLDHTLSSLSTLHGHRDLNLVLIGDGNLARLVPAGRALIRPHRPLEGPSCGLIPTAGPAVASSTGLRYDMDRLLLQFGGLVSSSNVLEADEVAVETDADLVWMTQLRGGGSGAAL